MTIMITGLLIPTGIMNLQIEYETLFAPSVIVFNGNNQVLYKIEYEEKMLSLLSDYFTNTKN